ncbi:MAG: hypothetical protein PVI99_05575 [Anaerolineales bacterium]|jgi:hypothetical protein
MFENIDPQILRIVWIVLVVGAGWIVLRFLLKIARKIFSLGCLAIVVIGFIFIVMQFIQGG